MSLLFKGKVCHMRNLTIHRQGAYPSLLGHCVSSRLEYHYVNKAQPVQTQIHHYYLSSMTSPACGWCDRCTCQQHVPSLYMKWNQSSDLFITSPTP